MKQKPEGIRVRLCYPSWKSIMRLFLCCMLPLYLLVIIGMVIEPEGLLLVCYLAIITLSLVTMIVLGIVLPLAGTVYLTRDTVTVCWFGWPVKQVEASRFKSLCAMTDIYGSALCLSCLSPDEMTQAGEALLAKGLLTRHDVPLRKKNPNWRKGFILDYLNWLRSSVLRSLLSDKHILLCMDAVTVVALRQLYPQLPYLYSLDRCALPNPVETADRIYSPALGYAIEKVQMAQEGISSRFQKKTTLRLEAPQILTVVRTDLYANYDRRSVLCYPLLMVCGRTAEEMAALSTCAPELRQLPLGMELAVMEFCYNKVTQWTGVDKKICPLCDSSQNEAQLRALYPQAEWIDLSHMWREDSVM